MSKEKIRLSENQICNLDWNLPLNVQEEAISKIVLMKDLDLRDLLQPYDKKYWENAAKVLFKIGYPRVKDVIPGLLEWMQDINWPGAYIVEELLSHIPKDKFVEELEKIFQIILDTNDLEWIFGLENLINKFNVTEKDFLKPKLYNKVIYLYREYQKE